ncbi:MAG: MBL fold metallo-hydrolase [Anaerostipes sp.]|nr:MBL fold metallo-hydrolase [Anaerostipes sp.]
MRDIPELTFDTIKRMEDMSYFTHALIFDDLLIVAQKETACYIWKTAEGLVIFDGIWPDERVYREIQSAINEVGWENEEISKFVISHGHIDHVGCGKWLVDNHNTKTYLSKADDKLRLSTLSEEGRSDCWKEFSIDCYMNDGECIDCGDKTINIIATPGHTAGCMSFIFPVYENGERHMACLFGGATAPWGDEEGKMIQRESILKFMKIVAKANCDVALTNHTTFDIGLERILYSQSRLSYMPNIYILGEEGVQKFCNVFLAIMQ